jgi:hypothetical protein
MPFLNSVERVYAFATLPAGSVEFNYPNFSSTTGLVLVGNAAQTGSVIYITTATGSQTGNVYRSTAIPYNRSFNFEWNFECSGGGVNPADGFCVQWTTTNNSTGLTGGGVSRIADASTINALTFQTYTNKRFTWYKNNVSQTTQTNQDFYRNLFYWADYNHGASTMNIYFSTTNTKPVSANFTLTGFTFDSTNYYIGFGAATGGAFEDHILRSMKLTFT